MVEERLRAAILSLIVAIQGCSAEVAPEPWVVDPGYTEPVELFDPNEPPWPIVPVQIEVDPQSILQLESNPFNGPDVLGAFVDEFQVRTPSVDLNYRGAYALLRLIQSQAQQRNWKVKFPKNPMYRNRREWNFNFEPSIRHRLAYDLMRLAGVKVPNTRHVFLSVNRIAQGIYLEYEDPDNKPFLLDKFGDDRGDLYKAATDVPNQPKYFATLEYLGQRDASYYQHYRKMTNNDDPARAGDFGQLREFLKGLNLTSDRYFERFLRLNFEVEKFISYLVVSNFVSNWDSYPQRPKNFWLFQVLATHRWVFLPWDLDSTFQPSKSDLNQMGTDASVFYQLDGFIDYPGRHAEEGTARPLVRRMMRVGAFRSAYLARYREALSTFLSEPYLIERVRLLSDLLAQSLGPEEAGRNDQVRAEIERFIIERSANVRAQLARLP